MAFLVFAFSGFDEERRNNFSERNACTIKKSRTGSEPDKHNFIFWTTPFLFQALHFAKEYIYVYIFWLIII